MRNKVSYSVARNCMTLIKDGGVNDAFESLGINPEDFDLVCSNVPFVGVDRNRVTSVLTSLIWGTLDVVGLPRIEVPTEFIASVLCVFVSAGNLAVACRFMESGSPAEDLAAGGSLEPVTADQLFALCCQLWSEAPAATAAWERRTGRAVRRVLEEVSVSKEQEV